MVVWVFEVIYHWTDKITLVQYIDFPSNIAAQETQKMNTSPQITNAHSKIDVINLRGKEVMKAGNLHFL